MSDEEENERKGGGDVVICTAREPSYMTSPISIIRCKGPLLHLYEKCTLFVSKIKSGCPKMIGISRPPYYIKVWPSYLDDPQIDTRVTTDNNKVAHVRVPCVQLLVQHPTGPHASGCNHWCRWTWRPFISRPASCDMNDMIAPTNSGTTVHSDRWQLLALP